MKCSKCGKKLERKVNYCAHCGHKIGRQSNHTKLIVASILALFLLFVGGGILSARHVMQASKAPIAEPNQEATQNTAEGKIAGAQAFSLKQPISVPHNAEITVNELSFGNKAEGRFSGYTADDGKTFAMITANVKSLAKEQVDEQTTPHVSVIYDNGYEYKCFPVKKSHEYLDRHFLLEPLTNNNIIYLVNVDPSMAHDGKALKIKVQIGTKAFVCRVR
ncbi:zinc-ribbon domain-containing protein [Selenomonas ruminantium]|uniref:Zinc-ribbon domain-containing protein n=1 Tax=Selenomonas ruminantium TaxID=971 RepID=A0A1M6WLX5_SELRU|nr:zinc ribbon domain-containing protein [Selenomonas ruminantium]SHK94737.1 zinc-ribbon domain-containing protein [Selenomonas ruminantium]